MRSKKLTRILRAKSRFTAGYFDGVTDAEGWGCDYAHASPDGRAHPTSRRVSSWFEIRPPSNKSSEKYRNHSVVALACRILLIAGTTAAPAPTARANDAPAPEAYAGYVLGLHIFDMTFAASLQPSTYRVEATFRLVGAPAAFWRAEGSTTVSGHFLDGRATPDEMVSTGRFSGTTHSLRIHWQQGSPEVMEMAPPAKKDREPVPAADQAGTVDTLSAVAALIQRVATTGHCDGATRTFDGIRLAELSATTAGHELLKPTDRSSFQGDALRCDLTVRMIGGFLRDDDNAQTRRAKQFTVWLARIQPDGPPIPVRVAFHSDGSPGATAYLR